MSIRAQRPAAASRLHILRTYGRRHLSRELSRNFRGATRSRSVSLSQRSRLGQTRRVPSNGEVLADAISSKVSEIIATLERLSDEQWRRTCASEGWPVGLVAFHIALGIERQGGWIEDALEGRPVHEFSWDRTDEMNAAVARAEILPSRPFVLAGLAAGAERLRARLQNMSDIDADRVALSYRSRDLSVQVLMQVFMRHIDEHHASIRNAVHDAHSE